MHDFFDSHQPPSTAMDSAKNVRIRAAMDQLDSQDVLNYAAAVRAFKVDPMTLAQRYRGETVLLGLNWARQARAGKVHKGKGVGAIPRAGESVRPISVKYSRPGVPWVLESET
jgi:hypothetical protein